MQEFQRVLENIIQCFSIFGFAFALFYNLIGEAVPEVGIDFFCSNIETKIIHIKGDVLRERVKLID